MMDSIHAICYVIALELAVTGACTFALVKHLCAFTFFIPASSNPEDASEVVPVSISGIQARALLLIARHSLLARIFGYHQSATQRSSTALRHDNNGKKTTKFTNYQVKINNIDKFVILLEKLSANKDKANACNLVQI